MDSLPQAYPAGNAPPTPPRRKRAAWEKKAGATHALLLTQNKGAGCPRRRWTVPGWGGG